MESYRAANNAYGEPPVADALNVVPFDAEARKVAKALAAARARPAADYPADVLLGSATNDELNDFLKKLLARGQ